MHGAMGMAKGRKRVIVEREPNGRAQREREYPPAQVKRLRDAAMAGLRDPEWGTELGRLYLCQIITAAMYAAGKRWREWAHDWHASIGVFPVRSTSIERGSNGMAPDPFSRRGMEIAEREREHTERFFRAHAALFAAGPGIEPIVRAVCERDEIAPSFSAQMKLRRGLNALAIYWDLTGQTKSRHGQNVSYSK